MSHKQSYLFEALIVLLILLLLVLGIGWMQRPLIAACLKTSNRDGGPFEVVGHSGENKSFFIPLFTCDTV